VTELPHLPYVRSPASGRRELSEPLHLQRRRDRAGHRRADRRRRAVDHRRAFPGARWCRCRRRDRLRRRRPALHHPAGARVTDMAEGPTAPDARRGSPVPSPARTRAARAPAASRRPRAGALAPRPGEHEAALAEGSPGRAARARARLPAGADAVAVLRDHARRPAAAGSSPRTSRPGRRSRSPPLRAPRPACTCTPRCSSAPTDPVTGSDTTRRSWSRPTAAWSPARASSTSRSPPATTRTATSAPARPRATRSRWSAH
jgi:hypothetical protein